MNRDQLEQLEIGDLVMVTRGVDKGIVAKVMGFSHEVETRCYYRVDYFHPVLKRYGYYDEYGTSKFKTEEELFAAGYKRLDRGIVLESLDPTIIFNSGNRKLLSPDRRQRVLSYEVCKPLAKN